MRYKVSATMHGKRITTTKYWTKRGGAQRFADHTNYYHRGARARVVKGKR